MKHSYKLWIAGEWLESKDRQEVRSPFTDAVYAEMHQANPAQMEKAIAASVTAFEAFKKTSRYTRSRLLLQMVKELELNREKFLDMMIHEAGKPRMMAEAEFGRALSTFTLAAEEAKRFGGEIIPLDMEATSREYSPAVSHWVPRGPILAITPFNFPLNLMAHKVAPALALGASVLLKPPPQTPGCAILLAEIFEKVAKAVSDSADHIPGAAFQVVSGSNEVVAPAVSDPRLTILSFTGSDHVGWMLQGKAIRKKVLLELGGNAAVIIHRDADLQRAAKRCVFGAFAYAGQSCISVQRIFVQKDIAQAFTKLLIEECGKVKFGNPEEKDMLMGPVINAAAANRIEEWISEAKQKGARLLAGGERKGNLLSPVLLANVPKDCKVSSEEVFGPLAIVNEYEKFSDALKMVNDSRFGLQAGVFTDSAKLIQESFSTLDVGGVVINEVPTYRADIMPYGGVKDSGLGREGLRYAMEDYCERKVLIQWVGK